jgi:hypothetical protein
MMLSPLTVTRSGIGAPRPGNEIVHPDVVPVAVMTDVVAVVSGPLVGTAVVFHLPAMSARLIGPAAADAAVDSVVAPAAGAMAVVSVDAFRSVLAHAAKTTVPKPIQVHVSR